MTDKLRVDADDLSDLTAMGDARRELGLARQIGPESTFAAEPNDVEAKFNIAHVLDVPISCMQRFVERAPCVGAAWRRRGGVT